MTSARASGAGREQNRKAPLDHSGSLAVDDLLDEGAIAMRTMAVIRHLVAAVNKMDLVGWDEGRFRRPAR